MASTLSVSRDQPDATQDAALQRALRKNLVRLVPLLAIGYFFNYIDRTNIGFAALTMNRDLGLTGSQFGMAAGLFFVGYCVLEVPSNLALYRFGARRWLARIMISWGLLSAACAFTQGPTSFYVLRVLTGAAEAGFFPGVLFYLSCWFPKAWRVRVLAWFLVAIPLSSVVGGVLAAFIMQLDGAAGLKGWQWLFVVEGLPACLLGLLTLWFLRDRPEQADWLTREESAALSEVLARESAELPKRNFGAVLRDTRVWIMVGILFCYWIGINGIAIWLPLMLKGHGLSTFSVGLLSGVPYLVAAVVMIVWARLMERHGRHLLHLALACVVSAAGLIFAVVFFVAATGAHRHGVRGDRVERCAAGVLQPAVAVSDRDRGGGWHGVHQLDGQPRRVRRPVDGRRAQGHDAFVCTRNAGDVGVARARRAFDMGSCRLYAT